jgi:hypothetical protein
MKLKPKTTNPIYITCEVCLAEIPVSVSMSSEADDYAQHFCGIECYNIWRDTEDLPQSANDKPDE